MSKVDLYEFSDLLECAEKIGYDWNEAHNILVNDQVPPMYETKKRRFCIGECSLEHNDYGYSKDTIDILQAFFKQENLEEFTIT